MTRIELKRMIENNHLDLLNKLSELVDDSKDKRLQNLILLVKNNFIKLNDDEIKGIINPAEYSIQLNKVKVNTLSIIDELPDDLFDKNVKKRIESHTIHSNNISLHISNLIRELFEINIKELEVGNKQILPTLNSKRGLLVNQIVHLIEKNNHQLSGAEYQIIAESFHKIFDNVKAEQYYEKAISTINEYTDSAMSKITIIRGYADFLYRINKPETGAYQYKSAILEDFSDDGNAINGYTLQMEFNNEVGLNKFDRAIEVYKNAKRHYMSIRNENLKNHYMSLLHEAWNSKLIPFNYTRP